MNYAFRNLILMKIIIYEQDSSFCFMLHKIFMRSVCYIGKDQV